MSAGKDTNTTAAGTAEGFWDALLDHIVEKGRRTPKVQVERAIGPILGFFLEKAVSDLLGSEVITLAAEFPLKKKKTNQSTNIDWLMYDRTKNELLLIELKTEASSFSREQLESYLEISAACKPWKNLVEGFEEIFKSSDSWKYDCALKNLMQATGTTYESDIADFKRLEKALDEATLRVIYIAPQAVVDWFDCCQDLEYKANGNFYPFKSLKMCGDTRDDRDFDHFRERFYDALQRLDEECVEESKKLSLSTERPYQGLVSLNDILAKCDEHNLERPIVIGFTGGLKKLRKQNFSYIKKRLYKWSWASDKCANGKSTQNWIKADDFSSTVKKLLSPPFCREDEIQRLAKQVSDGIRNNPDLTLGQLIEGASRRLGIPLDELSDDELVKELTRVPTS